MKVYRLAWAASWGSVTALAAAVGVVLSGPAVPLTFALMVGLSALLYRLGQRADDLDASPSPTLARVRRAASLGLRAGSVAFVFLSATRLLGLGVLLLILVAVLTSPPANRWLYPSHFAPGSPEPHFTVTATAMRAAVEILSDADLRRGWRGSYVELCLSTGDPQRLELVNLRQAYLDEMERRDPRAVRTWLSSQPWATSEPAHDTIRRPGSEDAA